MTRRRLSELAAPQIIDHINTHSVVIQTVGAIEQHGAHLPLETDLVVAASAAEAVVEKFGDEFDLWLLPPLVYTRSTEHSWARGTISASTTTFLALLNDLGRSLAKLPTPRLAFLNGHGGNTPLLSVACRDLRLEHGLMTFLLQAQAPIDRVDRSSESEMGMGIHAGMDETSVMLHLRPDLVDLSKAKRNVPEGMADYRHVRFRGSVGFGWTSDDFGSSGVIGDPTGASAERGELLFDAMVTALGEGLREVARFEFPNA